MGLAERLGARRAGATQQEPKQSHPAQRSLQDPQQVLSQLHAQVVDRLGAVDLHKLDQQALAARVSAAVSEVLQERAVTLPELQQQRVTSAILNEIVGLGPLEPLLADPSVSDILVNGASTVYVERNGVLEGSSIRFRDDEHLLHIISRIVARVGRRIDESSPMVDARLPDGSRVNAVVPPLALDGPLLSIRRFGTGPISPRRLVESGSLTDRMLQFLSSAVRAKCNVLVCGGTGTGKTTMLNALSSYIPAHERIITIEDAAELRLQQSHVARMETRPPNIEGKGEVGIRELVRNALRMRPDRIVVGEVRSHEVLDMIQAMNTGHEGSMTTVHANSAAEAITRLMSMMSMTGIKLSEAMMLKMLTRSLHLIVHVARHVDGVRRVSAICELSEANDAQPLDLRPVFRFVQREVSAEGRVIGEFESSGNSALLSRFRAAGVPLHPSVLEVAQ